MIQGVDEHAAPEGLSVVVFIVGMAGAGKRQLGNRLAEAFGLECVATFTGDEYTQAAREDETQRISTILPDASFVAVTSTYAPLDEYNRERFKRGKVVYLYSNVNSLWEDMTPDARKSSGIDSVTKLHGILEEMNDIYLKVADCLCYNDGIGQSAYHAAKQFIETSSMM